MDDSGGSLSSADLVVGGLGNSYKWRSTGSFSTAYQTTAATLVHSPIVILLPQVMLTMGLEL